MTEPKDLPYSIEHRQPVARTEGLKVTILTLAAGEEVPWHSHSIIDDDFFCMQGPMVVETRRPDAANVLNPGETLKVPVGRPHRVTGQNGGPCRFLLVQGVGEHDFISE
ncbi:MAG: cupin domain-containing protein [Alphaproteobacteria bacterium]|nr:cupin domain-containing protein [Alphaproteobacteria bacterium]